MNPGDIDPPSFDVPDPEPPSSLDPTLNVAEPVEVRKRTRKQAQEKQDRDAVLRDILSTPEGRREMWAILDLCGTFQQRSGASANGSYDPTLTHFHAGQKAIGQHLFLDWLARDRDSVLEMLVENSAQVVGTMKDVASRKRKPKTRPAA